MKTKALFRNWCQYNCYIKKVVTTISLIILLAFVIITLIFSNKSVKAETISPDGTIRIEPTISWDGGTKLQISFSNITSYPSTINYGKLTITDGSVFFYKTYSLSGNNLLVDEYINIPRTNPNGYWASFYVTDANGNEWNYPVTIRTGDNSPFPKTTDFSLSGAPYTSGDVYWFNGNKSTDYTIQTKHSMTPAWNSWLTSVGVWSWGWVDAILRTSLGYYPDIVNSTAAAGFTDTGVRAGNGYSDIRNYTYWADELHKNQNTTWNLTMTPQQERTFYIRPSTGTYKGAFNGTNFNSNANAEYGNGYTFYEYPSTTNYAKVCIDNTAPTIQNAWIDGVSSSGYSIHIRGVSDNGGSGVQCVKVPTWTENNGQDDIIWYTAYPDGNGNIDMWIPITDHNNETGHYFSHIYTYDNVGNVSNGAVKALDTWIPPHTINSSAWVDGYEYKDSYGRIWVQQGNTFTLSVNGYTEYYDYNQQINSIFALIRDDSWNQTYFNAQIANNQNESWNGSTHRNDLNLSRYTAYAWRASNWTAASWDTAINEDGKTIYAYPLLRVYRNGDTSNDSNIISESQWWQDGTGVSVTSDGRAPTITDARIENVTPFGYDVVVEDIDDNGGSGVDNVQLEVWNDNHEQKDAKWHKINTEGGYITYHVDIKDNGNENGVEYNTYVHTYDKVGNNYCVKTLRVMVPNPYPVNSALRMEQYNFQQYSDLNGNDQKDSNEPLQPIYWVKPTTSSETNEFKVYTEGYFPSSYGIDPTRTYVLFAKDGNLNMSTSARQYAEEYGVYKYGSEFDSCFNFTGEDYAQITEKDSKKYISATHVLQAKNHGDKFKLYYTNSYIFNGTEYYSGYIDSGVQVKVDGKPPDGSESIVVNYENLDMDITASGVSDPDSGINGVWALIYPGEKSRSDISLDDIDSATTDGFIRKRLTKLANGSYSLHMNAYNDAFKSEKITVAIGAKDNVGNKVILNQEVEDLFTLKARVVPLNNKSYNSTNPPVLKQGQAAVLIMETTGEAESLDIKYEELDDLDKSLKRDTITIDPKKLKDSKEDNFIVPLYAPNKAYKVTVIAHRGDSTREAYPEFVVSDSVLYGIKTKIKN